MSPTALLAGNFDFIPEGTPEDQTHAGLASLYRSVLDHETHFDEFKQLLALYDVPLDPDQEPEAAATIRERLNARIREWVGRFEGLDVGHVLLCREIIIDQRVNIAIAPWSESNAD